MDNCIFCKIINNQIPAAKRYEDDECIIIDDISPQAEKHYLLIPKQHYANVLQMSEEQAATLGKCLKKVASLVDELGLKNGFRLAQNNGSDACQTVNHLHVHILGGAQLLSKMC
jgi:histidine triad (HIT) family protein